MAKKIEGEEGLIKELNDIKRLMVLRLIREGVSQSEIAIALGVNQSSVSRMFGKTIAIARDKSKN